MTNSSYVTRPLTVACAVLALLQISPALRAAQTTSLTVQTSQSGTPQVRSVLRDSASNERVAAASNETVELLFADGTSLTLAPGAAIFVDQYRYDSTTRTGELRLRIDSGLVRVTGGALNNSTPVQVTVPGGLVQLDNAIAFVDVGSDASRVSLVSGRSLSVSGTSGGVTLNKAGTSVALSKQGTIEGKIAKLSPSEARKLTDQLNPGLTTGVVPMFVTDSRMGSVSVIQDAQDIALAEDEYAPGTEEDLTAKDVKFAPVLPDPTAPAVACSGGACTPPIPNFDLGPSIGVIGDRQSGRSTGNQWALAYVQGDEVATETAINAPAPDYDPAGGFRNTTARIFTSAPASSSASWSPYAVTLDSSAPPTITNLSELAVSCSGSTCPSIPVTNLYDPTSTSQTRPNGSGVVYMVAGQEDGSFASDTYLTFAESAFAAPRTVSSIAPLSGSIPPEGTEREDEWDSRNGDQTTDNESDFAWNSTDDCPATAGNGACRVTFADAATRDAELARLEDSPPAMVDFEGVFAVKNFVWTPDPADPSGLTGEYYWIATSQSSRRIVQAGFSVIRVGNTAESLSQLCDPSTSTCQNLAIKLFGDPWEAAPDTPPEELKYQSVSIRSTDSFLAFEEVSRMPGDNQRLFYATGSVSGRLATETPAQGITLDRFSLSPGLVLGASEPLGRAFLRPDTLLNIAPTSLLTSPLYVLNAPYTATISSPSRALQYDFALTGSGNDQTSTISVTLGTLTYSTEQNAAQLSGRTVGSIARSGASTYSGGVQSALFSTAAGGGNSALTGTGRAGYLVLENYDPVSAPTGGLERTIGSGAASSINYAQLRFGQVVAGGTASAPIRTSSTGLTGYLGGFAQVTSAPTSSLSLVPVLSDNLQLQTNATDGSVTAAFSASFGAAAVTTVNLGGATGLSAYTGEKEFAAMTAAAPSIGAGAITDAGANNAALVSGAPLLASATQGWTAALDASTRSRLSSGTTSSYRHLQWGYFFGDVTTADGASAHSHLTSWIAGRATPEGTPLPTVEADYAGHVAAEILNGDRQYSAIGTYTNHWDFARRSGTGAISLDGQNYSIATRLLGLSQTQSGLTSTSTTRFEGLISNNSQAGNVGSLAGTFVSPAAATTDPLAARAAMMGQFSISQTLNGVSYDAIGTFGAERTGP